MVITTTTDFIPEKKVSEVLGVVRGSTIRAKHIGRDIMASFKTIIGGEIKSYTKMLVEAREEAFQRMIADGQNKNANAILNIRFMTAQVMPGAAEIMAYGTAVKLI
jgi:uncharacterized protein YbjQ (UPF0145 family)